MDINERIEALIKELRISKNAFAESLNTSSSRISNITTKRNKPDSELLEKILEVYTNVSGTWLLTGQGQMFIAQGGIEKSITTFLQKTMASILRIYFIALDPISSGIEDTKDLESFRLRLSQEFKKNIIVKELIEEGLLDDDFISLIIDEFLKYKGKTSLK